MRTFWHPYTNDAPEAVIDVTGMTAATILIDVAKVDPTAEDAYRLVHCIQNCRPFNDPRLGCLRYEAS